MPPLNRFLCCAAAAIVCCASSAVGETTVIYVNAAATGANDGTSWADAFVDLHDALAAAAEPEKGTQIWVAAGEYVPGPADEDPQSSFHLVSGVAMYGGFAGWEDSLDERDFGSYQSVLRRDFPNPDATHSPILTGYQLAAGSLIDGFTIRDGYHWGLNTSEEGTGGLLLIGYAFEIAHCNFINNFAFDYGGAIQAIGSTLSVSNCTFVDNAVAIDAGGAIQADDSSLFVSNSAFITNDADGGAGIGAWNSTVVVNECEFLNNAGFVGMAINTWGTGALEIVGCAFQNNYGEGPVVIAGSISELNVTVEDSMFLQNSGGLHVTTSGTVTVTGCTFIGNNFPGGDGGGAFIQGSGTVEISDCSFDGNSAFVDGGGLFLNISGTALISDCHFANNSVDLGDGGGIMAFGAGEVHVVDSSIEGNFAGIGGYGAAAGVRNGSLIIERSTVNDNWGGLYAGNGGSLTVIDSVITDNFIEGVLVRPGSGSAGEATIINSIISNNIGDGVHIGPGPSSFASIINSTIVNNSGTFPGSMGGVFVKAGHADVRNSIIWGNGPDGGTGGQSNQISAESGTIDVQHSIIEGLIAGGDFDLPGMNNLGDDPLFVDPNPTDGKDADFRLQPRSPAIDAGDNAFVPDPDEFPGADTDLDGNPRIIDGTGDGVAIVDLGAYEFQPAAPSIPGDLNGDGSVGVADLLILLANWGPCADCAPGTSAPGNCPADLTGDGSVGVEDLLILLANWG